MSVDTTIDLKVIVECKCGNALDIKYCSNYRSGELTVEVEPCSDCMESAKEVEV